MKKTLLIIAMVALLTGCGRFDRWWASTFGGGEEICQDGVLYLQFASGVSVAYNPNGTIRTCK